jgi:hypothetical protein
VLLISDINMIDILISHKNSSGIINYAFPNTTIENSTCQMFDNENITIVIDDFNIYFATIEKLLEIANMKDSTNIVYNLLKAYRTKDIKIFKEVCFAMKDTYFSNLNSTGFNYYFQKIYEFSLNGMCNIVYNIQNNIDTKYVVYRGENVTSKSHGFLAIKHYFANEINETLINKTNFEVVRFMNKYITYATSFRTYLIDKVDQLVDYFDLDPEPFEHYVGIGTTIITGIMTHPVKFYNHITTKSQYTKESYYNKYMKMHRSKIKVEYAKYFNILKRKTSELSMKIGKHIERNEKIQKTTLSEIVNYNFDSYDDYIYFNGSCTYLNESSEGTRTIVKIFNYISISNLVAMWNPATSTWKPTEKNATSIFRFYSPADWIAFIISYFNRWRRSFYFEFILGPFALEEDTENCKPGWPLYRDPAFGCPITKFEVLPFYYTLEEDEIIKQNQISSVICEPWNDPFLGPLQGWIRYINAVFSPYISFPFLIPTALVCRSTPLQEQLSWAFWEVNGTIPCTYTVYDLPPFAEPCLFLKSLIFWALVFVFIFIVIVLIVSCIRCCITNSTSIVNNQRLQQLEKKGLGYNYVFIKPDEEAPQTSTVEQNNWNPLINESGILHLENDLRDNVNINENIFDEKKIQENGTIKGKDDIYTLVQI